jgi:putative transposase
MRKRHSQLDFAGSMHFITTVTRVRGAWFTQEKVCRYLLELFEGYREKFELTCFGYVLMPDHLHAIIIQKAEGAFVPKLMEGFKSVSSRNLKIEGYPEHHLWADRYDDVPLPGLDAVKTRIEYIHDNPVRKRIVLKATDYQWSSARDWFDMSGGIITIDKSL